jgi:two-component system, NtrC family, sensor kinase
VVTQIMRTLSARILLGFVALTITFGVFTATIVRDLREAGEEATRILDGYVPIALASGELARNQHDLKQYLDEKLSDATRASTVEKAIAGFRNKRRAALAEIDKKIDGLSSGSPSASDVDEQLPVSARIVGEIKQALVKVDPLYETLLTAPPLRMPPQSDAGFQAAYDALDPPRKLAYDALQELRKQETAMSYSIDDLQDRGKRRMVFPTKAWLTETERPILARAIYLGIAAVVLGVLITAWVAVTLRPLGRLREAARRIAAGDYGKRIPETGPAEISDLAREFNSMGRAVQEREEEKLRAARLAMVGKMAAQIAHEVRNPLSSIGLNTELLEDELGDSSTEARELCRAIHTEVNRLTEVTETYLGLRGGKPKLARESLNAIIDDLVDFVRHDLATRHVALATELDPEDPTGTIDANQIRQCLINLVRNAADAVSANGGGQVVVRTRGEHGRVEIAVEDNGIGIPSELIPRLFDPFFSTKERGNGLGLALTQQIIQDHGGEIHVASRVGRGTTFTLSVPAG